MEKFLSREMQVHVSGEVNSYALQYLEWGKVITTVWYYEISKFDLSSNRR